MDMRCVSSAPCIGVYIFKNISMIPIAINNQTYFFSVSHITSQAGNQLIYGISLNNRSYFFSKTLGINACKQLDSNAVLETVVINELCFIITEIELTYQSRPSLALINLNIFQILGRIRNRLPVSA
jgi:hypothetical protein